MEDIFCSEQISIPPALPEILKDYCKAAIRTQPYDLLKWSAAYFKALANGEELPVKERLEYPPYFNAVGLTRGYVKVILNTFRHYNSVLQEDIVKLWRGMSMNYNLLECIFSLGGFSGVIDLQEFISVTAGYLTNRLRDTMILMCELLTDDPEGGLAKIPVEVFLRIYKFLANLDGKCNLPLEHHATKDLRGSGDYIWGIGPVIPGTQVQAVVEHMKYWSDRQEGMVMPFNIEHALCPPLCILASEEKL